MDTNDGKPIFSQKLLKTAPDGTHRAFAGTRRVAVFSDRFELDGESIEFQFVRKVVVHQNVLHLYYATPEGEPVEEYFRYDTFLQKTAIKQLADLKAFVDGKRKRFKAASSVEDLPVTKSKGSRRRVEIVEGDEDEGTIVIVNSGSLSFPPFCPACLGEVSTLATLRVGKFGQEGFWLVPVCDAHTNLSQSLRVLHFSATSSGIELEFEEAKYAARFARQNRNPTEYPWQEAAAESELAERLHDGTRFVMYQYAVGAMVVGFTQSSNAVAVSSSSDAIIRGLPFTALSFLLGWWVFPWGPVLILGSLIRNCGGGADVTEHAKLAAAGRAVSAYGVET